MNTESFVSARDIDVEKLTICWFDEKDQKVVDAYIELTRHLQELRQLFQMFRFNLEALLNSYTIYSNDHLERNQHFSSSYSDFIAINAFTTNLISSGRVVVDSVEKCMEHSYGKDSVENRNFRTNCQGKIYQDNFAYRFFYHLRNFSQHMHLPVSISNGLFSFDLWQILNTPHFDKKKEWEEELSTLNEKVIGQHGSVFRVSYCITLAQYTAAVAEVYHEFWKNIKGKIRELRMSIAVMVGEHPDVLVHEDERFNGYLTYVLGENDLHMFRPDDDIEEMYEKHLQEAADFAEGEQREYDTLMESVRVEWLE